MKICADYGELSEAQQKALRPFVRKKSVLELGAGALTMARALRKMGACLVTCVDKNVLPTPRTETIKIVRAYHDQLVNEEDKPRADVLFTSWPQNVFDLGLLSFVEETETIVYLGKNTDGTACAFPAFWQHVIERQLLAYVPEKRNTLIVYGPSVGGPRIPKGEEFAALHMNDAMWSFEEMEGLARVSNRWDSRRSAG